MLYIMLKQSVLHSFLISYFIFGKLS